MAPDIDASVHRQLGELVAGLRGLKDDIQEIRDAQLRSEDKSTQSRAVVHRRMDEMVSRVGTLERHITNVQTDVADMKPVTNDVKRWKLMGIGALGMIGIGGIALGVSFADVLKRVGALLIGRI
ncbi:glucose-6-phosphate isomerase [Agrobacterium vitis]|nr:glucose-6-phosphate isomerase [Agrobacterium vitis]MBE1437098.1 glucose-6-phosphate isomerase [Agrobacterium vitis]